MTPAPGRSTLTDREPALQLFGGEPAGGPADQIHRAAAAGVESASQSLPYAATIQRSFGRHDISGVRAQIGGDAELATRNVGAHSAYAYGDRVAFARAPDLRTAAHEAAHVVQQRMGVSGLDGGIGRGGDRYEQHADAVADAVVAGRSAEPIFDELNGSAAAGPKLQHDAPRQPGPAPSAAPRTRSSTSATSRTLQRR